MLYTSIASDFGLKWISGSDHISLTDRQPFDEYAGVNTESSSTSVQFSDDISLRWKSRSCLYGSMCLVVIFYHTIPRYHVNQGIVILLSSFSLSLVFIDIRIHISFSSETDGRLQPEHMSNLYLCPDGICLLIIRISIHFTRVF